MRIEFKKPLFTRTVIRDAAWNIAVMIGLYLMFNIFSILVLDRQLEKSLDTRIAHEIEHFMNAFYFDQDSLIISNPRELMESDLTEITENPFFLQVYDTNGSLLIQSMNIPGYIEIAPQFPPVESREIVLENRTSNENDLRIGYQKIYNIQGNFVAYLQLAAPKSSAYQITRKLILFNVLTFPVTLIIIIIISIILAKKSFAPINKIIDVAKRISANNLKERLRYEADPHDEMGRLRDTLNHLFDRLESQIKQIADFTDNASHQLLSPLTVFKTELDYMRRFTDMEGNCKESISTLREQSYRMIQIVQTMLFLAKDCNDFADKKSVFNLSQLIDRDIRNFYKNQNISYRIENDIHLRGNKDYFSLVIQNLINNAIKYTTEHPVIVVSAYRENSFAVFSVEDNGCGIPDEEKKMIFERFYRGAHSLSKNIRGNGLGLSLVRSIVDAMDGTIAVEGISPTGTRFVIKLQALKLT
ncbi:MAG: sensor histidine kinase [Calditrichaceae bacterium]